MNYKYHYTYRITNTTINKHYYGSRSTNTEPTKELGNSYISSSKDEEFIKDQKSHPEDYKYKVIKIFLTRDEATQLEIDLHVKFNVATHEKFYNNSNQTSTGFLYGFLGKSHSEENMKIFRERQKIENEILRKLVKVT